VTLGSLEPIEIGAIVAGVLLIAGFVWWRLRQGRKTKDEKEHLDTTH
jgi:hypothetical protein